MLPSSGDQTTLAQPRPLRKAGASRNIGSSDRVVTDLLLPPVAERSSRRENTKRRAHVSNGIVIVLYCVVKEKKEAERGLGIKKHENVGRSDEIFVLIAHGDGNRRKEWRRERERVREVVWVSV